MAPRRNEDEKVKVETHLPMTTFKRLLLWGWVKCQSRAELIANTIAARAEANEAQFMADLARRAADKGISVEELEQQIYQEAGLEFETEENNDSEIKLSLPDNTYNAIRIQADREGLTVEEYLSRRYSGATS